MPLQIEKLPQLDFVFMDVFHLKLLYKALHLWITEEGYDPGSEKWMEKLYVEKITQKGKEHWIWWRCEKTIDPFFKYELFIDIHTLGIKDVEIMHQGKKLKTNKGEIEFFINGRLVMDPKDDWDKNLILRNKHLKHWYLKRFYKGKIDEEKTALYSDMMRLMDYIKQYLELKTYLHEYAGEAFIPTKGFNRPTEG